MKSLAHFRRWKAARAKDGLKHLSVGKPYSDVVWPQTKCPYDINGQRDNLRIGKGARLSDQVAVELEVLSKPPPLLPLVPKQLGNREPADGFAELAGLSRHHACQGRRHLRPQGDLPVPLVREVVQLPHDLISALGSVEVQRLQRWAVVLLEAVPGRHRAPGLEDVGTKGEIVGVKITKARKGLGFHPGKLNG